ncbi:hypothetical protein DL764_005989 [Monosporascus ibericus]|uniref:Cupin type-1 domain-containing protein n=1 Tax=Monosporascus ibericus TaxID=155417 RepID=A0A4Q4T6I5_9PEZI|nr:hypothetical protein DL764_005989 [Monosporascus ibericus]
MVDVQKYQLPPTALVPNSPKPLLYYPVFFKESDCTPSKVYEVLNSNGWQVRWLIRYGLNQQSHYHSAVHECMVVLSGSAKILFGVADLGGEDSGQEEGGILLEANVGDVFILPAGLAHKTHDATPPAEVLRLSPGDGHNVSDDEMQITMGNVQLSGFTMLGAYPRHGSDWDISVGGDSKGKYDRVWSVPNPENDPVLGKSEDGICGHWC